MEETNLNTREQFAVLIVSTVVGFLASKFAENHATRFIKSRKS
jgi:hypothetical protein